MSVRVIATNCESSPANFLLKRNFLVRNEPHFTSSGHATERGFKSITVDSHDFHSQIQVIDC